MTARACLCRAGSCLQLAFTQSMLYIAYVVTTHHMREAAGPEPEALMQPCQAITLKNNVTNPHSHTFYKHTGARRPAPSLKLSCSVP